MKNKPSDYQKLRYVKKENVPNGGGIFIVTDFDEVDKSTKANQPEWRIRLTFDERWWFEVHGGNLDTAINLLGNDFDAWLDKPLGLCIAGFTTKEGEEKEYLKIVPATDIRRKPAAARRTREDDDKPIPFS
jgi:hypothetical protein